MYLLLAAINGLTMAPNHHAEKKGASDVLPNKRCDHCNNLLVLHPDKENDFHQNYDHRRIPLRVLQDAQCKFCRLLLEMVETFVRIDLDNRDVHINLSLQHSRAPSVEVWASGVNLAQLYLYASQYVRTPTKSNQFQEFLQAILR